MQPILRLAPNPRLRLVFAASVLGLSVCLASTGIATSQGQATQVATPTVAPSATPTPTPQPATGMLAGRVVDSAGTPVPNAIVSFSKGPAGPTPAPAGGTGAAGDRVLADDTGRFVFSNLAAGAYSVAAFKPGWLAGAYGRRIPGGTSTTLELADAERRTDLAITMWRAAVIAGRVTADNGDPMIGVEVRAMKQVFIAGRRQSETRIRAKTDDLGSYRFSGLMPGEYLVAVLSSVLSEPPSFAGAIRAGNETPRAYYQTMTAVGVAPIVFDRATGVAGSDRPLVGSLSQLPGVPSADAPWPAYPTTFHPSSPSMRSATVVRAVAGEVRAAIDVTVHLTPTWQVSGVLRDPDGPAAWNAVHLISAESADTPLVDTSTAVTDAKGAFTLYGVPPGQYIARVVRVPYPTGEGARMGLAGGTGAIPYVITSGSGAPGEPSSEPLLHVSEAVTVANRNVEGLVLTMREGPRIRGRARYEGSKPVPGPDQLGAPVYAVPANGRIDTLGWPSWPGRISSDGQFQLPSQWPGRYLIRAFAPPGWVFKDATYQGRNISDAPIDLTADLDNVVITFIENARTIKGTVRGDAGQSVGGVSVLMFPTDPAGWVDYGRPSRRVTSATLSAQGGFTLELPPAGDYYLIAVPAELMDGWQNPAVLAKLAASAERIVVRDVSITQALQLKEIR